MSPIRSEPGVDAGLPDLEIRIMEARDEGYPVEITLDDEQVLGHGLLDASVASWIPGGDPAADGRWLLEALLAEAPLRSAWLAHAARLGEPIRARTGQESREGVFEGIDAQGNLILRMGQGPVAIPAAEVFF